MNTPRTPPDDDRRAEIEALFEQADRDDDGRIDAREFRAVIADLDPGIDDAALEVGFRSVDVDGDGLISFAEFVAWWSE